MTRAADHLADLLKVAAWVSGKAELPPVSFLREALAIDPATGAMTWKRRPATHFQSPAHAATWNAQFPGTPAFATLIRGYLHGIINGRRYRAHRIAFALYTGVLPTDEIDHIDGDRLNNALANLREVSSAENKRNLAIRSTNTSGTMGVSYAPSKQMWRAYIGLGKRRQKHLGYFDSAAEATKARRCAEAALGYHVNHGRLA